MYVRAVTLKDIGPLVKEQFRAAQVYTRYAPRGFPVVTVQYFDNHSWEMKTVLALAVVLM